MKRLELLDYGRFFAALAVVAFHYFFNGINNGKITSISHIPELVSIAKYGYLGVEFFFMISGYVIFFSANNKKAGQFLASRAVRLFPAFWIAVLFTSVAAQFWGGSQMDVSFQQFFFNLTMFPGMFGVPYVDGVYWTLHYEWKFYFGVFLILAIGLQSKLRFILLFWPVYILFTRFTGLDDLPYSDGYYCYFAAGALFAIKKESGNHFTSLALLLSLYLCISFSAGKADTLTTSIGVEYSALFIGIIILFQYLFFILLDSSIGSRIKIKGSRLAGGLTYPIYLIHAHFGYMFISEFANNANRPVIYIITIIIVLVAAYLIHTFIELKLSKKWNFLFTSTIGAAGDELQKRVSILFKYIYNIPLARKR